MNIEFMVRDANKLIKEWEMQMRSADILDRGEWIRGVVHGLRLMMLLVHRHIHLTRGQRL